MGYILTAIYETGVEFLKKKRGKYVIIRFKGYHLHHSLYGLILLIIWIIMSKPVILGASTGIIVRHTKKEKKLTFIDKK